MAKHTHGACAELKNSFMNHLKSMVYQQQLSELIAPENVENCATESQHQLGTVRLLFTPWEGACKAGTRIEQTLANHVLGTVSLFPN